MNENIFNFDIALIMNLFRNGLRADWAPVWGYCLGRLHLTGWMRRAAEDKSKKCRMQLVLKLFSKIYFWIVLKNKFQNK